MRFKEISEDTPSSGSSGLGSLFGKGSDIGAFYNPGMDDKLQGIINNIEKAAKTGVRVPGRPPMAGPPQSQWDEKFAKYYNKDGTPKAPATGGGKGNVSYVSNFKNRTRNKAINPKLMGILQSASAATGLRVVIFSGGQDPKGRGSRRTGSTRHDNGNAADVYLYDKEGKQLNTRGDDPRVVNFVAACKRAGARGLGAHPGYMNGTGLHVDIIGSSQGGGNMWGAGGTGSPPQRIAQAFATGKGTAVT